MGKGLSHIIHSRAKWIFAFNSACLGVVSRPVPTSVVPRRAQRNSNTPAIPNTSTDNSIVAFTCRERRQRRQTRQALHIVSSSSCDCIAPPPKQCWGHCLLHAVPDGPPK